MDAGGAGNYSDNESYVMTFCSGSSDEIAFDFSSFPFGLQANNDVLTIWYRNRHFYVYLFQLLQTNYRDLLGNNPKSSFTTSHSCLFYGFGLG